MDPSITKSVFESFLHQARTICSEKYVKEELQFSVNMFVENEHKRTFLEASVKDYNAKKNTVTIAMTPTERKSRGYLILDQKLGKNLKR